MIKVPVPPGVDGGMVSVRVAVPSQPWVLVTKWVVGRAEAAFGVWIRTVPSPPGAVGKIVSVRRVAPVHGTVMVVNLLSTGGTVGVSMMSVAVPPVVPAGNRRTLDLEGPDQPRVIVTVTVRGGWPLWLLVGRDLLEGWFGGSGERKERVKVTVFVVYWVFHAVKVVLSTVGAFVIVTVWPGAKVMTVLDLIDVEVR